MARKRGTKPASDPVPEPPDSGWAWVVLFACFTIMFLVIGFLASVSVYVYVWIDFFGGSAAETSLVISLCSFMLGFLSKSQQIYKNTENFSGRPTSSNAGLSNV